MAIYALAKLEDMSKPLLSIVAKVKSDLLPQVLSQVIPLFESKVGDFRQILPFSKHGRSLGFLVA